MQQNILLFPQRICETLSGDFAYTVGRLAFRVGHPMLVEHIDGLYLEHDLFGKVLTPGYGAEYNIMYVWEEEAAVEPPAIVREKSCCHISRKVFVSAAAGCGHSSR